MVLVQKWPFFQLVSFPFFFQPIQARKMFFTIFESEKTPFQAIKGRSSKSQKIDIFSKGLTHGLGLKIAIFSTFFFQAIQARKMFFMIFQSKETPFQAIKTRSSISQKIHIFPKGLTHGFGRKITIFQLFFFLGNIGQENVFYDILERRNAFVGYKNKKFKSRKIDIFPNGLTFVFGPKMAIFPTFFLRNIGQENVFYDILQRKNVFLGY